jgi:hypothetical protein
LGVGWHTVCMIDLLRTIAFRWAGNNWYEGHNNDYMEMFI